MKKRFCDVCEGEIPETGANNPWIETEGKIFMVRTHSISKDQDMDICQSCIIEAIGKLYNEQCDCGETSMVEHATGCTVDRKDEGEIIDKTDQYEDVQIIQEQCIHGTTLGEESKECMKDERDVLPDIQSVAPWGISQAVEEDETDIFSRYTHRTVGFIDGKYQEIVNDLSNPSLPDTSYPVDKRETGDTWWSDYSKPEISS